MQAVVGEGEAEGWGDGEDCFYARVGVGLAGAGEGFPTGFADGFQDVVDGAHSAHLRDVADGGVYVGAWGVGFCSTEVEELVDVGLCACQLKHGEAADGEAGGGDAGVVDVRSELFVGQHAVKDFTEIGGALPPEREAFGGVGLAGVVAGMIDGYGNVTGLCERGSEPCHLL